MVCACVGASVHWRSLIGPYSIMSAERKYINWATCSMTNDTTLVLLVVQFLSVQASKQIQM